MRGSLAKLRFVLTGQIVLAHSKEPLIYYKRIAIAELGCLEKM